MEVRDTGLRPGVQTIMEKEYGDKRIFYYNNKLYRKLRQDKGHNLVWAWDYEQKKRVIFSYEDYEKYRRKAFSTPEACELLCRHKTKLFKYIKDGDVQPPKYIGDSERRNDILNRTRYYWSEDDLMKVVDFLIERMKTTGKNVYIPSKAEIKAKINDDPSIVFKKTKEGKYVPTWRAT